MLSGVSQSIVHQYESGGRPFTKKTLDKLLAFYKMDYVDLFCPIDMKELKKYLFNTRRKSDTPQTNPEKLRKLPPNVINAFSKFNK